MHTLTLKEERFLIKIIDSIAATGQTPTIREAQRIGGFASSRTAAQYLEQLAEKGFVERGGGARSLKVLIDPRDARPARKKRPTPRATISVAAPTSVRPSAALVVDATYLDGWSHRRDAQSMLPQIIRKLVYATTDRIGTVTFRSGEGVHYPGFDGFTDFETRTSFVPSGPVVWELGTSGDIEKKAQADYRTRTDDPLGHTPAQTTFLFVTSRRWSDKTAWAKRRKAEKIWRDVRAYDADDLEAWLELAPGVHAWLSRALGKGADGSIDLATFAVDWFDATKPPLTGEFLLAGRKDAADKVKEWLANDRSSLPIQAETRDEAVAFFAAVMDQLPDEERSRYELRAVVIRDDPAWQQLSVSRDALILIPLFLPNSITGAERNGHRVVLPLSTADRTRDNGVSVGPIDREAVETIVGKLDADEKVSDNKARELAHLARRSMMAFRRVRGRAPELSQPAWSTPSNGPILARVMLAGAWNETREADREAVSRIVGMPYAQLDRELVRWSRESDAPVRHIGDTWLVVSKEDAWPLLHRYLTRDDLRRFHEVAVEILSAVDPRLDLEPEKQWMAQILGYVRPHSGTFFQSIANTLALLGTRGDITRATAGESAQAIASSAVRTVLDAANKNYRVWPSMASLLPLLAEAAPDRFLEAIEKGLSGPTPLLQSIFADKPGTDSMTTSSPHTYFLWALECLAWAPEYLPRAASALAKLAVLDEPRGTLVNRPDASLRRVFLCWYPQTYASLDQRLEVIDRLRTAQPRISWKLLVSLLPEKYDTSENHSPAEWRDWGVDPPHVKRADVVRGYRQVIGRVIDDVGEDATRWTDVINQLDKIPREDALRAIERLELIPAERFDADVREIVRATLRESISWHRAHPDARWELTEADIARLEAIHRKLEPRELTARLRWLFTRAPELLLGPQTYSKEYDALLSSERAKAVQDIAAEAGMNGVISFAQAVEMPSDVGCALSVAAIADENATEIVWKYLASADTALDRFARGFTLEQMRKRGISWATALIRGDAQPWSEAQRAVLLTFLPYDSDETWQLVDEQDEETQHQYWHRMYPWGVPESRIEYLARNLMQHGRPYTAADVLASHLHAQPKHTPPPALIAEVLEAVLTTKQSDDPTPSRFGYDLGKLVDTLAKDPGTVPLPRIAKIEWALVPLLSNHHLEPRVLHGELARDPSFFARIVAAVFRGKDEDPETKEFSADDGAKARAAYNLLHSWHTLPGRRPDGSVDAAALADWVKTARTLFEESRRSEIGDLQIGEILGASPLGDDGLWPHEAVRAVVETAESPEIERGIALRVYNSRGVVSKDRREGGAQERELVRKYTSYADAMNEKSPRTAVMLREITHFYESDAARSDIDVELRQHLE
jgi:hypothetical protein